MSRWGPTERRDIEGGRKRVTNMFHHAYFHWGKVAASAGQEGGEGVRVEGVACTTFKQSPQHIHAHTHMSRLSKPSF